MTTPNPGGEPAIEVVGLDQSIAYASTIAAEAGEHAPAGNEGYLAHLYAAGVNGPALASGQQMQAAFAAAQTAAERHAGKLDKQRTVQAAYDQAPDAGEKTYLTGGDMTTGATRHAAATGEPMPTDPTPDPVPVTAGPLSIVKDPLKIGGKLLLGAGETFAGSGSVKDRDGWLMLVAAVDTPHGRQVHIAAPIDDEDRKAWRGGNAPAAQTEIDDEDGEEYQVDTGADVTVVIDAADAARMPELVDDVIGRATAVDQEYRRLNRDSERLYAERGRLESKRFGSETEGERKINVDWKVRSDEQCQRRRRQDMDDAAARLNAEDRARYDELQAQVDAAGYDAWEPGREAEAAAVLDLTPDEAREMQALQRIWSPERTRSQRDRLDELDSARRLPPLLAEQAALVCGLTVEEYREMAALERIPKPNRIEYYNRRRRVRTAQEQARLDELDASPRGATGADQRQTYKLRGHYLSMLRAHHSSKTELADARAEQAAMAAEARPLDPAEAAELARITAELDAVSTRMDDLGGWASATAEIPARNGGSLVIEAIQQEEEGGVDYRMERKPADADADWSPGSGMDPFTTNAAGLRKAAKLITTLAG